MSEVDIPEVIEDHVGCPLPIGVLGPTGEELHRIEPVGFNGKTQLVYVHKRKAYGLQPKGPQP